MMFEILAMTAVVFISRYLFLEPKLPLRLGPKMQRFLSYSSPAVLTAIWAPIVFIHDEKIELSVTNPYFMAAILAVLLAWKTKNVLITTIISMACFFVLNSYLN